MIVEKIFKITIRLVVIYGTECRTIIKHLHKISVIEIRMLKWISGIIRKD